LKNVLFQKIIQSVFLETFSFQIFFDEYEKNNDRHYFCQ